MTRLGFDDLNPPTTARPVELAARARTDNYFVRDMTLSGTMTAAKTSLPVSGTYGFVGFDGLANISVTANPVTLAFVNPAGNYPKIKLGDLRTAVAEDTIADAGTTTVTLGGTATAAVDLVPSGNLLGPTPRPAAFTVGNWAKDDTAVSANGAAGRSVHVPQPAVAGRADGAASGRRLPPRTQRSAARRGASAREQEREGLARLCRPVRRFRDRNRHGADPEHAGNGGPHRGCLGYPLDSNQVAFRLDNSVASKPALRLDLLFLTGGVQSYSLDLDVEQLFRLSGSPKALDDIKRVLKGNSGTEVPYLPSPH